NFNSLMLYRSMAFSESGNPTQKRRNAWTVHSGGSWSPFRLGETLSLSGVRFADFDGDGSDEAFRVDAANNIVSAKTTSPSSPWVTIQTIVPSQWLDVGD